MVGCMPKITIDDMKQMTPKRPPELGMLDAFIGRWTSEGEAKFTGLDETIKMTGTSEAKWDGNGWIFVNRFSSSMADLGDMLGIETWTYDVRAKKFRTTWADDHGGSGVGTAWHDARTNTWHVKSKVYSPWGDNIGVGTAHFVDKDTVEWNWKEYAMGGLMLTMEMNGTNHRR